MTTPDRGWRNQKIDSSSLFKSSILSENKRWAGQILLEKTVADEVRSLMKELPCKLQYDWSRPINAESGRGNRLGRSGNKRPGTREILRLK
ncbi:hypothetical protein TNCV_3161701 [Trichonephila clavipes]|nr:hypothetical protein TNCV_3161701 [Trichonephila clavipes]